MITGCTRTLRLRVLSRSQSTGFLQLGLLLLPCAIGRGGIRARKREGDGATPRGAWRLRRAYFRPDKGLRPTSALELSAQHESDGWCDAALDRNYNRPVRHPYAASAERMWRADDLYDLVVVLDYNERPRVRGKGSAIFMHVARPGFVPTEGCVALRKSDLRKLLRLVSCRTRLLVP